MADYNSTNQNIIGTDYLAGVLSGAEDYIILPIDSYRTVALQGKFSKDLSTDGVISFEGQRWIIDRSQSNYTYGVDYTPSVSCTVSISNPYYCRGSLSDMSMISTRRIEVGANFASIAIAWGLVLCVCLSTLLRFCSRSRL